MKMRRILLVVLLVGGFWYLTTHLPLGLGRLSLAKYTGSPLELTEAQAAPAFDREGLERLRGMACGPRFPRSGFPCGQTARCWSIPKPTPRIWRITGRAPS
jgi:hypothetical protein